MDQPTILKAPMARVQDALQKKGLKFEIIEFSQSTRTANEAAAAIGCKIAQIIKSLLFRTCETNQPILILVSGKNRVNEQKIETLVGEKIVKADADFTREITSFAIGGIPPLDNDKIKTIFIDQDLFDFEVLWAAAGTPYTVFSVSSNEIQKLIQGSIVSVK
ncbi:MAG: YbaK/EbsC family protein [Proteobacteria bacterium]|nr:YbaK/EbsC family protein [Pseudomonadota bacterium]